MDKVRTKRKRMKFTFPPVVEASDIRPYFPVRQSSVREVPSLIEKLLAMDLAS